MTQALYAHMNNKRKMKKKRKLICQSFKKKKLNELKFLTLIEPI
jgi:hypothetical protein